MSVKGEAPYELGMIGLGVMGRNFLQNLADHGYQVAGYDKDREKTEALRKEGSGRPIGTADSVPDLVSMLRPPRAVMMLVPAGSPVDGVIHELLPLEFHVEWSQPEPASSPESVVAAAGDNR